MSINAHIKSVQVLADLCDHAFFSQELYSLLLDQVNREVIQMDLLATYFPSQAQIFMSSKKKGIGYTFEKDMEYAIISSKLPPGYVLVIGKLITFAACHSIRTLT